MKKTKEILALILIFSMLFSLVSTVFAADTDVEEVTYTREISDGSITLYLSNLELDVSKLYEFSLVTAGAEPTNWILISDFTANTATIDLNAKTSSILNVLKVTNTGFLYIREKDNTQNYVLENKQIDLTLPIMRAITVGKSITGSGTVIYPPYGMGSYDALFDKNCVSIQWEKVEDENIILEYLDIKNNNKSIFDMEETINKLSVPINNYSDGSILYDQIMGNLPNDGLYLLWMKASQANQKTIYGVYVYDGKENATQLSDYISINENEDAKETEEQEKTNDSGTSGSTTSDTSTSGTKGSTTSSSSSSTGKTDPSDTTTATTILPNTGKSIAITGTIALVIILAIAGAAKYYKYKDIK